MPPQTSKSISRPSTGSGANARARLAAEQASRQRRRRRMTWVGLPIAVVLVVVAALVVVKVTGVADRPSAGATAAAGAGSDAVVAAVTTVPSTVLDQVGAGSGVTPPSAITAPALTADGKPRVLYVGAEYCPYCAAERWAVVVALSRFGTFSGLGQTASAAQDVYPSTATLTFHGSSYTSQTVSFTGVETKSNQVSGNDYAPLDTLDAADEAVFTTYNAPPYVSGSGGSIPFIDIGGKYLVSGASFSPEVLQGKTHEQIAAALSDPSSPIAQSVDGAANVITAAVCATTQQAPSAVCSSAGVQAGAKALG